MSKNKGIGVANKTGIIFNNGILYIMTNNKLANIESKKNPIEINIDCIIWYIKN